MSDKVRLVNWFSQKYSSIAAITTPAMISWSNSNSVEFCQVFREPRNSSFPYWEKQHVILEYIYDCDAILWLDSDCLIVDKKKTVNELMESKSDITFGCDSNGLCAGIFVIKTSGLDILKAWITCGQIGDDSFQDQTTIKTMVSLFPAVASRISTRPWIHDASINPDNPFVYHSYGLGGSETSVKRLRERLLQ